jgi:hypothetical protein
VPEADALRVLRHELRRRNTNKADLIAIHSKGVAQVRERYAGLGQPIPKNASNDALHADHVFNLDEDLLRRVDSVDEWLLALERLSTVVCVTAEENYRLERVERTGVHGWGKYAIAGVELIGPPDASPL